jgi:hypothetical protein
VSLESVKSIVGDFVDHKAAPGVVKAGGTFEFCDLVLGKSYKYQIKLGASAYIVMVVEHGKPVYIGTVALRADDRFRHAGASAGLPRSAKAVEFFGRVWRRYLHRLPSLPDINDEVAIRISNQGFGP